MNGERFSCYNIHQQTVALRQRLLLSFVFSSDWKIEGRRRREKGIHRLHKSKIFKRRIVAEEFKMTIKKKKELAAAANFNKCEVSYNNGDSSQRKNI